MKSIILILLLALISKISYSQTSQQWTAKYNGTANSYDASNILKVDRLGNIYVSGYTNGKESGIDFLILKYNSSGLQQWVRTYDNPKHSTDDCYWMTIDDYGNVYQSGISDMGFATIKYNPSGEKVFLLNTGGPLCADNSGNLYISEGISVLVKYNSSGNKLWERKTENAIIMNLVSDNSGNILLTGTIENNNSEDIVALKYDYEGNLLWKNSYRFSPRAHYRGVFINTDDENNVYVGGESTCSGCSKNDFVTLKYNSAGEQLWAATSGGSEYNSQYIRGLAVDKQHNIYITGESSGDFATIKYNSNGEQQWNALFNGDGKSRDEVYGIAVDEQSNVYITGWSSISDGMDCVTIKYNSSGVMQWKESYHNKGTNCTNSIALDLNGNVLVGGFSDGENNAADVLLIKYFQSTELNPVSTEIPIKYFLSQNYPNPFNPSTTIEFSLPENIFVTLKIFDITGREIVQLINGELKTGYYKYNFDGKTLASGTYFYKLSTEKFSETKKMILVR
ncbi:MAG: SBBP repeat-containing protein [Ignavibacteria bacterium]|nr:SBBP repeat-containing protein [Ignavibacteria bacterium]